MTDLCGDVCILFPVSIAVVAVDIVGTHHSIHGLENNSAMVVSYHIGVPRKMMQFVVSK